MWNWHTKSWPLSWHKLRPTWTWDHWQPSQSRTMVWKPSLPNNFWLGGRYYLTHHLPTNLVFSSRDGIIPSTGLSLLETLVLWGIWCNSSNFKYMEVTLRHNLTWSQHIENICNKSRRHLGMLYRNFWRYVNAPTLLMMYKSIITPHMEYTCAVWDSHLANSIKCIENTPNFLYDFVARPGTPAKRHCLLPVVS